MARTGSLALLTIVVPIMGLLAASPASAQFPNIFDSIFGNPPARPPADVPERPPSRVPQQSQQPQQQYYPPQSGGLPPGPPPGSRGIQSQPLPPPPGAASAPPRSQQPQQAAPGAPPAGQPQAPPPAASTEPPPPNETVVEPPPNKIPNPTAVFAGLDKITGRIISFDVAINETVRFGALEVTPRACYSRPPTEAPTTDAFVEVDELTLQGELKRIFSGWMFAASPGLNAVEHPIYDVWLTDCKGAPQPAVAEAPAAQPAAAPAPRTPPRAQPRPPQRATQQLPAPPAPAPPAR